jgi:pentatricopeptide repeat protein
MQSPATCSRALSAVSSGLCSSRYTGGVLLNRSIATQVEVAAGQVRPWPQYPPKCGVWNPKRRIHWNDGVCRGRPVSRYMTDQSTNNAKIVTNESSSTVVLSSSPVVSMHSNVVVESDTTTSSTSSPTPTTTSPPPPTMMMMIPESFFTDLQKAALWQENKSYWNIHQCRILVAKYDDYLKQLAQEKRDKSNQMSTSSSFSKPCADRLLSAEVVILAFKVLMKCKVDTPTDLAANVRQWERYIGHLGRTPLTDHLSLRLLTANAKSGSLGRCLSLLELRAQKQYSPRDREFLYTITAVQIAAGRRGTKNIYVSDADQPLLDNPTRWLDAILIHMKQRQQPLTKAIAMRMLQCYAGTGYTGKASHHFYRVARLPTRNEVMGTKETDRNTSTQNNDSSDPGEKQQQEQYHRPRDWYYVPELGRHSYQETQVKLHYSRVPPPFYKIPAQVQGKLLYRADDPPNSPGQLRIERESDPDYSIPLASAFAFAHSLQQGACGHDPVIFNVECYNALIKACVYRGALWRAMNVLDNVIRNSTDENGVLLRPNHISYNMILAGLARVGDVITAQRYYQKMLNEDNLVPDAFTVRAIVDGLLNLADAPAAVTVVQDFFNQHSVLPPYTTHCKILEFCLARGMIYEAKRYVYFIQQLWHWKPVENYHSKEFIQLMRATQHNTQLQKPALQKLFAYFGETLDDRDFL